MNIPRILIVDDEDEIRQVYRMILSPPKVSTKIDEMAASLFEEKNTEVPASTDELIVDFEEVEMIVEAELQTGVYEIVEASQGQEAIAAVQQALLQNNPISLMFLDIRMPPGIDGVLAAKEIRRLDPDIEIVIMTAYSDYSFEEIIATVGNPDRLLYFRKPFKSDQIRQLASTLTQQWYLEKKSQQQAQPV